MGYVPLFDNLTTGTLHGRWPDIGLWPVVLSMADRFGKIDVTPQCIASATGLPLAEVVACLERFCEPDPDSRSKTDEDQGRRLELLDPNRKWGWRVVNHAKYREKARLLARDSERTATGMDAARKRASRAVPPLSPEVSPSDGDGDGDVNKRNPSLRSGVQGGSKPSRRCPEDWNPTPEAITKIRTECPSVDLELELRKLKDHEFAKPRKDWPATWRNWIREAQRRERGPAAPRLTRYEELMQRAQAAAPTPPSPLLLSLRGTS